MKLNKIINTLFLVSVFYSCTGQTKNSEDMATDSSNNNPLICNPVEGICEMPHTASGQQINIQQTGKNIKVIYFTDPICSSCWGIEPQLRKLKLEYGSNIDVEYRMGGLLPDWSYNSGGISKPSDVGHHWDEVSGYYDMPIDGDVWLEDPLDSSYPPSIAFKAAQIQDQDKALLFLRELREMVFLKKKNIAKWSNIVAAAEKVGLDTNKLKADYEGKAKDLFQEDLKLAKELGVRGFPTMFFTDSKGTNEVVYGSKPYAFYEISVLKLQPDAKKAEYKKDWKNLFAKYRTLTAKEFSELSGIGRAESETALNELVQKGELRKITTKNGSLWILGNDGI